MVAKMHGCCGVFWQVLIGEIQVGLANRGDFIGLSVRLLCTAVQWVKDCLLDY